MIFQIQSYNQIVIDKVIREKFRTVIPDRQRISNRIEAIDNIRYLYDVYDITSLLWGLWCYCNLAMSRYCKYLYNETSVKKLASLLWIWIFFRPLAAMASYQQVWSVLLWQPVRRSQFLCITELDMQHFKPEIVIM